MYKDKILELLKGIERVGITDLIDYLETSDFFTAPASSKNHGNYTGGLAEHSYKVYELFKKKNEEFNLGLGKDTVVLTAICHDLCKIGLYREGKKWRKDKNNKYESYKAYEHVDELPLGHGEKSVILLQSFIPLTESEMLIIRWHMGGFESKDNYSNLNKACKLYPACVAMHTSDLESSNLLEKCIVY